MSKDEKRSRSRSRERKQIQEHPFIRKLREIITSKTYHELISNIELCSDTNFDKFLNKCDHTKFGNASHMEEYMSWYERSISEIPTDDFLKQYMRDIRTSFNISIPILENIDIQQFLFAGMMSSLMESPLMKKPLADPSKLKLTAVFMVNQHAGNSQSSTGPNEISFIEMSDNTHILKLNEAFQSYTCVSRPATTVRLSIDKSKEDNSYYATKTSLQAAIQIFNSIDDLLIYKLPLIFLMYVIYELKLMFNKSQYETLKSEFEQKKKDASHYNPPLKGREIDYESLSYEDFDSETVEKYPALFTSLHPAHSKRLKDIDILEEGFKLSEIKDNTYFVNRKYGFIGDDNTYGFIGVKIIAEFENKTIEICSCYFLNNYEGFFTFNGITIRIEEFYASDILIAYWRALYFFFTYKLPIPIDLSQISKTILFGDSSCGEESTCEVFTRDQYFNGVGKQKTKKTKKSKTKKQKQKNIKNKLI